MSKSFASLSLPLEELPNVTAKSRIFFLLARNTSGLPYLETQLKLSPGARRAFTSLQMVIQALYQLLFLNFLPQQLPKANFPLSVHSILEQQLRTYCVCAKSLQSCPTFCDPIDCSPPGSTVHEVLQARILEWVVTPSSRGSSWARDWIQVSYLHLLLWQEFFTTSATWEAHYWGESYLLLHCLPPVLIEHVIYSWSDYLRPKHRIFCSYPIDVKHWGPMCDGWAFWHQPITEWNISEVLCQRESWAFPGQFSCPCD